MCRLIRPSHTYRTKLTEEEVSHRLSTIIEPEKHLLSNLFSLPEKPYKGIIHEREFRIKRAADYTPDLFARHKRPFLPTIDGIIKQGKGETAINITITAPPAIEIYIPFSIIGFTIAFIAFFLILITDQAFNPFCLLLCTVFLTMYFLPRHIFKLESHNSKKYLQKVIAATTTDDNMEINLV